MFQQFFTFLRVNESAYWKRFPKPEVRQKLKKAIEEAILDGKIDNDYEKALDYLYQIKDDYIS